MSGYDAVVLAGGRSRRFGGGDKTAALVGGRPLLDRTLAAVAGAARCVVVGTERPTSRAVTWVREEPAYAGPVHALAAGLPETTAPHVVVLAGDLPLVTADTVATLLAGAREGGGDGAVLVDSAGRVQPLAGAWSRAALVRGLTALPATQDAPMSRLLERLEVVRVSADGDPAWLDVDTAGDIERAEAWLR